MLNRRRGMLAVPLLAAVLSGCGNPGNGEEVFAYEPVPVVTIAGGTPVSVDPGSCATFFANRMNVLVEDNEAEDFIAWAAEAGFVVEQQRESSGGMLRSIDLIVPPGSVPDAISAANRQPGVVAASPFGISGRLVGYPSPTPPIPCER